MTVEGEYGPETIALMLVLIENENIVVPLSPDSQTNIEKFVRVAQVEHRISVAAASTPSPTATGVVATHDHYHTLRRRNSPGLVLFTSGSTGENKAAVHDFVPLLKKFEEPRRNVNAGVKVHHWPA